MEKISFRNDILPLKNKLFRLALRITLNSADAEDIVQETLIKVWKKRESWDEIESIEAFCYSICRNLALDRTRRADKFNESLDETQNTAVDTSYSANPEERVQQGDRMRLVNLSTICPKSKEASFSYATSKARVIRKLPTLCR